MKQGSLFTGIGGFDLGFERAGFETTWQVEIEPVCHRILEKHWPGVLRFHDIKDVRVRDLPEVDVITFGSPCQNLSIVGNRKGLEGEQSQLFYEATRILFEMQPAFAVWENVPGALSSNNGRDFLAVLREMEKCGYRNLCWRVLDAQYFGVPQGRQRIFLVGGLGDRDPREILFERDCVCRNPPPSGIKGEPVTTDYGADSSEGG